MNKITEIVIFIYPRALADQRGCRVLYKLKSGCYIKILPNGFGVRQLACINEVLYQLPSLTTSSYGIHIQVEAIWYMEW